MDFGTRTSCFPYIVFFSTFKQIYIFFFSFVLHYFSNYIHFMEVIQMLPKSLTLSFIVLKIWHVYM